MLSWKILHAMSEIEKKRFEIFSGPSDEDTASVFCFSGDKAFLNSFDILQRAVPKYWLEKRKATTGAMYPYWLVCRSDACDTIAEVLRQNGINWNDIESHFYKSVKAQSGVHALEEELSNNKSRAAEAKHRKKPELKKWWRFWK